MYGKTDSNAETQRRRVYFQDFLTFCGSPHERQIGTHLRACVFPHFEKSYFFILSLRLGVSALKILYHTFKLKLLYKKERKAARRQTREAENTLFYFSLSPLLKRTLAHARVSAFLVNPAITRTSSSGLTGFPM